MSMPVILFANVAAATILVAILTGVMLVPFAMDRPRVVRASLAPR